MVFISCSDMVDSYTHMSITTLIIFSLFTVFLPNLDRALPWLDVFSEVKKTVSQIMRKNLLKKRSHLFECFFGTTRT
jgi:hypothetical protein